MQFSAVNLPQLVCPAMSTEDTRRNCLAWVAQLISYFLLVLLGIFVFRCLFLTTSRVSSYGEHSSSLREAIIYFLLSIKEACLSTRCFCQMLKTQSHKKLVQQMLCSQPLLPLPSPGQKQTKASPARALMRLWPESLLQTKKPN